MDQKLLENPGINFFNQKSTKKNYKSFLGYKTSRKKVGIIFFNQESSEKKKYKTFFGPKTSRKKIGIIFLKDSC